jgi:hypothetical protein
VCQQRFDWIHWIKGTVSQDFLSLLLVVLFRGSLGEFHILPNFCGVVVTESWHSGDTSARESWLPGDASTRKSKFPGDASTGGRDETLERSKNSLVVQAPGSQDSQVLVPTGEVNNLKLREIWYAPRVPLIRPEREDWCKKLSIKISWHCPFETKRNNTSIFLVPMMWNRHWKEGVWAQMFKENLIPKAGLEKKESLLF